MTSAAAQLCVVRFIERNFFSESGTFITSSYFAAHSSLNCFSEAKRLYRGQEICPIANTEKPIVATTATHRVQGGAVEYKRSRKPAGAPKEARQRAPNVRSNSSGLVRACRITFRQASRDRSLQKRIACLEESAKSYKLKERRPKAVRRTHLILLRYCSSLTFFFSRGSISGTRVVSSA